MAKTIIGVMGPGKGATEMDRQLAFELGKQIATNEWILLTGGRDVGVMDAASRGAKTGGGTTVGILPSADLTGVSKFVDIPVRTGMGSARNNINVLTSDVVIACGAGLGTISEIVLAYKADKPVVLLHQSSHIVQLLENQITGRLYICNEVDEVVKKIKDLL